MAGQNPFRFSTKYTDDETGLLYYGYRYYNPSIGRWISRDPSGERGGVTMYAFISNCPIAAIDVWGLWGSYVHDSLTEMWAQWLDISVNTSTKIGQNDDKIDTDYDPTVVSDANWSWHFNRSSGGDSRLSHKDDEVKLAKEFCGKDGSDDPDNAAIHLGRALHPLQDWVAHGDFNNSTDLPNLNVEWYEKPYLIHNWTHGWEDVDNSTLDANGPDGRATSGIMNRGTPFKNGGQFLWTDFHGGSSRLNKTESLTKELLKDFQDHVLNHTGCKCKKAFLKQSTP